MLGVPRVSIARILQVKGKAAEDEVRKVMIGQTMRHFKDSFYSYLEWK